jgi:hypothetical protein
MKLIRVLYMAYCAATRIRPDTQSASVMIGSSPRNPDKSLLVLVVEGPLAAKLAQRADLCADLCGARYDLSHLHRPH